MFIRLEGVNAARGKTLDPNRPIGADKMRELLREMAIKCDFANAKKHAGRSRKRKGISDLVNSRSMCDKDTRMASRHKSDKHLLHQELGPELKNARCEAQKHAHETSM